MDTKQSILTHIDSLETLCLILIKVRYTVTQIVCKRKRERDRQINRETTVLTLKMKPVSQAVCGNCLNLAKRRRNGKIQPMLRPSGSFKPLCWISIKLRHTVTQIVCKRERLRICRFEKNARFSSSVQKLLKSSKKTQKRENRAC